MRATVIEPAPTALMEAMELNLVEHVSFLQRRVEGMRVDESDELMLVDSGLKSDTFNKILRARLEASTADRRIVGALAHFSNVERPFTWWVGPCSRPLDLEARLERHGLRAAEYELGMTIALETLAESPAIREETEIRRVTSERELSDFTAVLVGLDEAASDPDVAAFFGKAAPVLLQPDCPMRFYVAYVNDEPAATCELFVGGGVAGIHMVATRERFRRRGLGMALTWRALADGRVLGWKTGALQASLQGQPLYERLGFVPCGRFVELAPGV